MALYGKHILSVKDIGKDDLNALFTLADDVRPLTRGEARTDVLRGAVMGSLFFEPSTRTRLSFDSAFMRLGGSVSNTQGKEITSIVKGESYFDTSRVVSGFYDVIVMRHPEPEAIDEFCSATNIPVINGGSGAKEHPTQALLDVYTMQQELGKQGREVDGITITLVGDLKYGRTVHSLACLLTHYRNITFYLVHPDHLGMPDDVVSYVSSCGHTFTRVNTLADALASSDVVYATRLQKERLGQQDVIESFGADQQIRRALIQKYAKKDLIIMHPLPRDSRAGSNDLSNDLNDDPRLAIFRQTDNGILIRMALFCMVMGVEKELKDTMVPARWFKPEKTGTWDR